MATMIKNLKIQKMYYQNKNLNFSDYTKFSKIKNGINHLEQKC